MWYIRYFHVDKHSLISSNALRIFSDLAVSGVARGGGGGSRGQAPVRKAEAPVV